MSTDKRLIEQVADGDEMAFRTLYERYSERTLRYVFTLLRNRHLAEEVVQDTMVAVWKSAAKFAGRSKVSTWIFGIARNKALDLLRKEKRGERIPDTPLVSPDPSAGIQREQRVKAALETLSEDHREVVFLTFYEQLSYAEISGLLGVPEGTVKSRMFHAKRKLAEALG